jgi:thioredoxin-like negative regulator of GroEL
MSIFYPSSNDFYLQKQIDNSVTLNCAFNHISLILFYSPQCLHCNKIIPVFKSMPQVLKGCSFAMVNVNTNRQLITMSQQSNTPITYVPLIILYYNGVPMSIYNSECDVNKIKQFIYDFSKYIQQQSRQQIQQNSQQYSQQSQQNNNQMSNRQQQQYSYNNPNIKNKKNGIGQYILGTPLTDEVTYLEFTQAYQK